MQSKQLSTNDLAVFDLDAVVIICVERGSQIHGIRPLSKLIVGDVHRTLCRQSKLLLHVRRMVRETSQIGFGPAFQQQTRLEHFEIISSVSISTYYRSSHVAHAKIYV